ncbi:hypothetical protein D3C87_2102670 [compost metagenome]
MFDFMHDLFGHYPGADNRWIDAGYRQWPFNPVAADGGVDMSQLQRRDHQPIAKRESRAIQLAPEFSRWQQTAAFTG